MLYVKDSDMLWITDDLDECPELEEIQDKFFSTSQKRADRVLRFRLSGPKTSEPLWLEVTATGLRRNEDAPGIAWIIDATVIPSCPIKMDRDPVRDNINVRIHFSFEREAKNHCMLANNY